MSLQSEFKTQLAIDGDEQRSWSTNPLGSVLGGQLKRALDVFGALVALVLLAPLFLMVAAIMKLSDPGPVFFAHSRIGHGGRSFLCLKFRTMVTDSPEVLARHLAASSAATDEWEATRKLRNDPRVTPLGEILRKTSLDELPQLLNILRGEMSFVGPRPVVLAEIERYGASRDCYLCARPGLTGLWQVSGRNDVSYQARVGFDQQYAETWSLWNDFKIVLRTIPAVMKSEGVY